MADDTAKGRHAADRLSVGVVGCGMIAQVMHLHYLRELSETYEIAALCDVSEPVARACADRYGVPVVHTSWQALVAERPDEVMVLTSGSHAQVAVAAAQAGSHVFVRSPIGSGCASAASDGAAVARCVPIGTLAVKMAADGGYVRLKPGAARTTARRGRPPDPRAASSRGNCRGQDR
ncbi:MAG TPA: Gfo/Idh/MocA family oxidoreductase, partial [Streptosporangiaceae bacterium]|nr:Gfo/Idh/MocA family oxidoreductase [Streptosporangiaceae bacterium]